MSGHIKTACCSFKIVLKICGEMFDLFLLLEIINTALKVLCTEKVNIWGKFGDWGGVFTYPIKQWF